ETILSLQEDSLGDAILIFTEFATSGIKLFGKIIDKVGLLGFTFSTVGVAVLALNKNFRNTAMQGGLKIFEAFTNIDKASKTSSQGLLGWAKNTRVANAGATALSGTLKGLKTSLLGIGKFALGAALPVA